MLRTNTTNPTTVVALTYKRLWTVEEVFRSMKSLLSTQPIWHKYDETIRGHVFCAYLALVLRKVLEDRLEAAGIDEEWAKVLADLDRLTHVDVERDGKRFRIRSKSRALELPSRGPGEAGTGRRSEETQAAGEGDEGASGANPVRPRLPMRRAIPREACSRRHALRYHPGRMSHRPFRLPAALSLAIDPNQPAVREASVQLERGGSSVR